MSPYVTHRDPAFWDDPETFDPSRFAGESDRPELAYLPFSAGRHACLGEAINLEPDTDIPVRFVPRA